MGMGICCEKEVCACSDVSCDFRCSKSDLGQKLTNKSKMRAPKKEEKRTRSESDLEDWIELESQRRWDFYSFPYNNTLSKKFTKKDLHVSFELNPSFSPNFVEDEAPGKLVCG